MTSPLLITHILMKILARTGAIIAITGALVAGNVALTGALVAGNVALANTGEAHANTRSSIHMPFLKRLEVNAIGHITAQGQVQSLSANSFTVKMWGGIWTVKTTASTTYANGSSFA